MMIKVCDKCGQENNSLKGIKLSIEIMPSSLRREPICGDSVRELCTDCFKQVDNGWKNPFLVDKQKEEINPPSKD